MPAEPLTGMGLPPLSGEPLERNIIVPPGASPPLFVFTVAVSVTALPSATLLLLATTALLVGASVTVMLTADDVLGLNPASPP